MTRPVNWGGLLIAAILVAIALLVLRTATSEAADATRWETTHITIRDWTTLDRTRNALRDVTAKWDQNPVLTLTYEPHTRDYACDESSWPWQQDWQIIDVCSYAWGLTGTKARSSVFQLNGFINYVWIERNLSYTATWARERFLLCHEIAHGLGLEHNTRPTSCVRRSFDPDGDGWGQWWPDQVDQATASGFYD